MKDWRTLPGLDPAAAACFGDIDNVFALEGQVVAKDSVTRTLRVEINGRGYYVKRYAGLGKKPLRRWFSTSRVQAEWENLQHFAAWGIPTAQLVAYGLESKGGRFVRGALITAEIPQTTDLRRIARNGAKGEDGRLKSRRWLDGISHQLAAIARGMHARRFVHGDLKWRNLLVDTNDKLYLIDCPSGGFWWPPFLEYRIVKDLACLDKFAKRTLSRSARLRFYLDYAQKKSLDSHDKRRIRKILGFFHGRDEDLATAASLRAAGRAPMPRQSIALGDGKLLTLKRWLRILPGKRLTAIGEWQGRKVLAKLFVAARGSERHWQRECEGVATLAALATHGLPAPALLAAGPLEAGGHFVLTEYLDAAHAPRVDNAPELALAFAQAGHMHAQGILQEDAHLDNFLLQAGKLYVVDGAAIRPVRSAADCAENLALLFAQLTPAVDAALRDELLAAYRAGNAGLAIDAERLATAVAQARQARLDDYLGKCLRDCSLFKVARRTDRFFALVRAEAKWLAPLIHDPDTWLEKGTPLKRGSTSTLARVEVNGRQLVIKRYNIKGTGHALSRFWRPSRAWHSWVEGQRLAFLGIPTPRPLALIERRFGPLRGRAWLITEYCPGERLSTQLAPHLDAPPVAEVQAIGALFAQLAAQRIAHGDLKAANLLWHEGKLSLVDLDATGQYDSEAAFARAWRKDRERLLRNWPETSALHAALAAVLPAA